MEALTLRSILAELSPHVGETLTAADPIEAPPGIALNFAPSGTRLRLHLQLSPPLLRVEPGAARDGGGRASARRGRAFDEAPAPAGLASPLKHLSDRWVGARLARIEPIGLGRVALLHFEARDRMGDPRPLTLVLELMGSFGNLILIDGPPAGGRILDRLQPDRRRDAPRSLDRGGAWQPPARTKSDLLLDGAEAVAAALDAPPRPTDAAGWAARVTAATEGVGPRLARELVAEAAAASTAPTDTARDLVRALERRVALADAGREAGVVTPKGGRPLAVIGMPRDASTFEAAANASAAVARVMESLGAGAAAASDLDPERSALARSIERRRAEAGKQVEQFRHELARRTDGAGDRLRGEALLSYAHEVPRGAESVTLPLGPDGAPTLIPLDPRRSAADNAARYFQEARKAERAAEQVPARLAAAEALLGRCVRFGERLVALPRDDRDGFAALESEWTGEPLRRQTGGAPARAAATNADAPGARRPPQAPSAALQPKRYEMPGGWIILVGRSQAGNDYLTHALAAPHDLWFHAHGAAGSHVVLKGPDRKAEADKSLIVAAAALAALNSKARHASKVPVIYAEKRHVRKPRGGKPGLAAVTHEKSIMVRPAEPEERKES